MIQIVKLYCIIMTEHMYINIHLRKIDAATFMLRCIPNEISAFFVPWIGMSY